MAQPEAYTGATVKHTDGRTGLVISADYPAKHDGPVRLYVKAHGDHDAEWSDSASWSVVNPGRATVPGPDGADVPVSEEL